MKKNFNLEHLAKVYTKEMKPTFEGWLFLAGLLLVATCYDLEQLFNIELPALSRVGAFICVYTGSYYFCWLLACIVFASLLKIKQHKQLKENKGKEIENNENK